MMAGTLAITGVGIYRFHAGFAGFHSKDAILESAYASGTVRRRSPSWARRVRRAADQLLLVAPDLL